MTRVVDVAKMSKSARRAYYSAKRGSWGGLNPVTRVVPNKKAYDRDRVKSRLRRET